MKVRKSDKEWRNALDSCTRSGSSSCQSSRQGESSSPILGKPKPTPKKLLDRSSTLYICPPAAARSRSKLT
ncbi:hypothetical protein KY290_025739 [Solanum tuberosum]|uniref:Uncharacterized protein n=1 Tax=Solanum tuberosum TaxID=4113 RepID=A0ABQ7UW44_SOLTU|nr:hypothetical protein KY289_024800 [Solanum tuberosum]KAH0676751.1 hypothetical protein KY285_024552 [Solanum tuberosum]KAH0755469.1 hypothetical protein KY290_025739 [Solanum tuberosum]